jgi:hypothetical protein
MLLDFWLSPWLPSCEMPWLPVYSTFAKRSESNLWYAAGAVGVSCRRLPSSSRGVGSVIERRSFQPPPPKNGNVGASLVEEESRAHHFGAVVSSASRTLRHTYRLANSTSHDVKIVEIVNRKPCCGDVRVSTTILHPGGEAQVEVTLTVRQEFGDIVHEVVVSTEPAQAEPLVLRTTAEVYPPLRIEGVTPASALALLVSGQPRLAEFRAFACGSSAEPAIDLGRAGLRSMIGAQWLGPSEDGPAVNGLTVTWRRFGALLDPAGPVGERKAEVLIMDGDRVAYRHAVTWEAVAPIAASPQLIVVEPGKREYRVVVRSRDQRHFRITRIECKGVVVEWRAASSAAALAHTVELGGLGALAANVKRGTITMLTDHPQGNVELPFVVLE